eukprot:g26176.t1
MADEAVQVAVRIRPFLPREKGQRQIVTVQSANVLKLKVLTTQLAGPPQEEDKVFSFDHCLSSVKPNDSRRDEPHAPPITQEQVYEAIGQNLLSNALEGLSRSALGQDKCPDQLRLQLLFVRLWPDWKWQNLHCFRA